MSILIKGMEMPKSDCVVTLKLYGDGCVIITREQRPGLVFTGMNEVVGSAVEIPPHGRLIDADALVNKLVHSEFFSMSDYNNFVCLALKAPTIIPASEEAKES